MSNLGITGVGMYVPDKVITNEEIEQWGIGASATWIYERSGIRERRISDDAQVCSDLAAMAAKDALKNANLKPEQIDLIVMSTLTPDFLLPQTSAIVKQKIKANNAICFDVQAACAGFVIALINAVNYAKLNKEINSVLVIGADTISKATDWDNRRICSITGDGAGAVVLQHVHKKHGIKSSYILHENMPPSCGFIPVHYGKIPLDTVSYFVFDGRYLYEKAKEHIPTVIKGVLARASWNIEEVDLFIFPQTNRNFIVELIEMLNIPECKTHMVMHKYGYTLNSCIPLGLHDAIMNNRLKEGDKVLLVGHGAGTFCAGVAMEWVNK